MPPIVARGALAAIALAALALCAPGPRAPGLWAQTPEPALAAPRTIVTRQHSFNIPFTTPAAETAPERQPLEVQLHVSSDQGASWQLAARHRPVDGQFFFRAPRDGDYLFAVRTLDASGKLHPETGPRPELRVAVDTREPQLELDGAPGLNGEVRVVWKLFDEHLAPESLKIDYQSFSDRQWRALAVELPRDGSSTTLQGEFTWWPEAPTRLVHLRAEVRDAAGNLAVVQRRVFLPAQTPSTQAASQPAAAERRGGWPLEGLFGGRDKPPPGDPRTAGQDEPGRDEAAPPKPPPTTAPLALPWPINRLLPHPPGLPSGPGQRPPPGEALAGDKAPATERGGGPREPPFPLAHGGVGERPREEFGPPRDAPPRDTRARPVSQTRAVDESPAAEPGPTDGAQTLRPAPEPPGPEQPAAAAPPRPEFVNSRKFKLDYSLEAVGAAGVAKVELWATDDGGRAWTRWAEDADRQSPIEVETPGEGVFGFRVVALGGDGWAGRPPEPGDLADLWVAVDTTPPEAAITAAPFGAGAQAGHLRIEWRARDAHFGPRPITLLFAPLPDGPWTIIAAGLANTGEYAWTVAPHFPPRIHLRLEARDEAGNVGTHQPREPISLSGLAPKARVRALAQ